MRSRAKPEARAGAVWGAMLSPIACNTKKLCKATAKACRLCKPACFRGDEHVALMLQVIRESMAPCKLH